MKKLKQNKGITLVALVITIIILLILAGISIAALTNTGLFDKAKKAKIEIENAQELENEILADYENKINELGGTTSAGDTITEETLAKKVKVGDYVQYTPDTASTTSILSELSTYSGSTANTTSTLTQEKLNWRVLDIKDGKVRLISELPTTSKVTLYGDNGYNNAVYLLDKTCSTLYNNSIYAEKVQNLKIEDIQEKMNVTDYSTITSNYGNTFSPTYKNYPTIVEQEAEQTVNGKVGTLGLSQQDTLINQSSINSASSWTIKHTYWNKSMIADDFKDIKYYELFIKKESNYDTYWMSSRCIGVNSSNAAYGVRKIDSGDVKTIYLTFSYKSTQGDEYAIRPVITLKSNVQIDITDSNRDGTTADKAYVLK